MATSKWILAAAAVSLAAPALAQPVIAPGPAPWSADNDPIVREFVTPDGTVHMDQTLRPGSEVPRGVPLKLFPASAPPRLQGYAYFVSADRKIVVVEADTRRVVHIIGSSAD